LFVGYFRPERKGVSEMIRFILSDEDACQLAMTAELGGPEAVAVLHPLGKDGQPNGLEVIIGHGNEDGTVSYGLGIYLVQRFGKDGVPQNVKVGCCYSGRLRQKLLQKDDPFYHSLAKALMGDFQCEMCTALEERDEHTWHLVVH